MKFVVCLVSKLLAHYPRVNPGLQGRAASRWDSLNGFANLLTCKIEFVRGLEVHPEIRRRAEVLAQTQGRISRYIPFACQNLIEPVGRHFE